MCLTKQLSVVDGSVDGVLLHPTHFGYGGVGNGRKKDTAMRGEMAALGGETTTLHSNERRGQRECGGGGRRQLE